MADILKPKQLAGILESIPKDKLDDAAAELGVDATKLNAFIKKPTGKFLQTVADKLGEGVEGAQKFVDKFVGRKPPSVPSEFAKEQIKPPGETGYQITGQPGGPLVPTTQTRNLPDTTAITPEVVSPRMQNVSQNLLTPGVQDAERVSTGLVPGGQARPVEVSEEVLAGLASKAKPGTPGQGVTERMTRNRPSLSDEFDASMGFDEVTGAPMSKVRKKAAGLGVAAAGAAGLASVGFSKVANAPVVVKEAAVDKVDDVAPLLEKAKKNVAPDKQAALVQQAQQATQVAKSIDELFKEVRDENRDKQARIELMKVTETIMHGLVTAIGANALLNRNSPFAVDFSQGPKTDWNAQFDRLQKDFDTQIGFLTQKYKIEEAGKRAVARETQRQAERNEDIALKREEIAAKRAEKNQEELTKLSEKQQKQYKDNLKNFALLSEAVDKKDTGNIVEFATRLGADQEIIDQLKKGKFAQGVSWLKGEKSVQDTLNGLKPQQTGEAAPAAATVGGKTYSKPAGMTDAEWAEYLREVGGQ